MPKTPDEIKKGLEEEIPVHYHIDGEPRLTPRLLMDMQWLHKDALALIQQLQDENAEKDERIRVLESRNNALYHTLLGVMHFVDKWLDVPAYDPDEDLKGTTAVGRASQAREIALHAIEHLEAERDAAVADIKQMVHDPYEPCFCDYCKLTEEECAKSNCRGRNAFVWRGVQKEDGNA